MLQPLYLVLEDWKYAVKIGAPPIFTCTSILPVSCLNKVINDKILVQTLISKITEEGKTILELEAILEIRTKYMRNRAITKCLIKWKNLLVEEETLEE